MSYQITTTDQAVDWVRYGAIEEMADLAVSYWKSIAEAAARNEYALLSLHCKQAAMVTREAFALVKKLGEHDKLEGAA